jgi:hypothetical protein
LKRSEGSSVSLSSDGTRIAIGAPNNDGNRANSGHVRIYEYIVVLVGFKEKIDGGTGGDQSGSSVSVSCQMETVLRLVHQIMVTNGRDSGHVRIYEYSGTDWIQLVVT